jgi:hypothetical protein
VKAYRQAQEEDREAQEAREVRGEPVHPAEEAGREAPADREAEAGLVRKGLEDVT